MTAHDLNTCSVTGLLTRFFGFDTGQHTRQVRIAGYIHIHRRRLPMSDICTIEGSTERSLLGLTRPKFRRLVSEREENEFQSF